MRYLCATLAALLVASGAAVSKPAANGFVLTPGVSPAAAMAEMSMQARAAKLRKAWLAAGNANVPVTAPVLRGGSILTPTVDVTRPPSAPAVVIRYKASAAGLAAVELDWNSPTTDQWMTSTYYVPPGRPAMTHGDLIIQAPSSIGAGSEFASNGAGTFGPYAAPGVWTLWQISIVDRDGGNVGYGPTSLEQLFPVTNITVKNRRMPDVTPPSVISGRVLTPSVSLSSPTPSFGVELKVADDLSGAQNAFVTVESNTNGKTLQQKNPTSAPIRRGEMTAYTSVAGGPTGEWTILGFGVYDAAGNLFQDANPADIQALFGTTTFTVTN